MPRTAAQAEASRRNGARSRGPRTPEGRRRSSQNARTHGLRAASFQVTPAEAVRFARLQAEICQRFRPRDAGQHDACRRLAAAFWRSQQLDRLEARIWPKVQAGDHRPLATLLRYRPGVERALLRALAELQAMRATSLPGNGTNEPGAVLDRTNEPGRPERDAMEALRRARPSRPGGRGAMGTNEPEARTKGTNEPGPARRTNEPGDDQGRRTGGRAPHPIPSAPVTAQRNAPNEPGRPGPNRRQRRRLAALGRQRAAT